MNVQYEIKISLLFVICLVGVGLILILKPFSCDSRPSGIPEYNYTPDLEAASYVEVEAVNQPVLPDTLKHIEPWVEQTVTASGYWTPDTIYTPEDNLKVEISGIEMKDGSRWVRVEIEGKPAVIERADWFEKEPELGRWSAGIETAILQDFDIGLFISYNLFEVWNIRGGTAIAVDLNTDLSESPDWLALECRLSTPVWRSVEFGGGIGPMFMRDRIELYVSGGFEVRFQGGVL